MELQDTIDAGVDLGADVELRLPDLVLLPLGTNKISGDPGLDDCLAHPLAGQVGRSNPEATLGSGGDVSE